MHLWMGRTAAQRNTSCMHVILATKRREGKLGGRREGIVAASGRVAKDRWQTRDRTEWRVVARARAGRDSVVVGRTAQGGHNVTAAPP